MKIVNIVSLIKENEIIDSFVEYDNGDITRCYSYNNIENSFKEFSKQENKTITELFNMGYIKSIDYTNDILNDFNKLVEYSSNGFLLKEKKIAMFNTSVTLFHILVNSIFIGSYDFSYIIGIISIFLPNKIDLTIGNKYFKTNKIRNLKGKQLMLRLYLTFLFTINLFTLSKDNMPYIVNNSYNNEIMNTNLDEFIDSDLTIDKINNQKIEKIFVDLINNPYLSQNDIEILMNMKEYYLDNSYLDLDDLYKKMMTLRISDKYNVLSNIDGKYMENLNMIRIFKSLDRDTNKRFSVLLHEGIHITGDLNNRVLNEGMTSQLEHEYYENEAFLGTDGYFKERGCVRVICYLIGSDLMLKAYSQENQKLIDDELIKIYGSREKVNIIYEYMELYCRDKINHIILYNELCSGNLTIEQQEQIPSYIYLSGITTDINFDNLFNKKDDKENVIVLKY